MKMLVKVRRDILKEGLVPSTSVGSFPNHLLKDIFLAFQPGEIELEELNMIIILQTGEIFLVNSIDFEFLEKDQR